MSGYPQDMLGQLGFQPDRDHFLAKPFSADALLRKVRDVLDTSALPPEETADAFDGSPRGGLVR